MCVCVCACVCVCVCVLLCLLLIRIHSRQNWIATRKHGVTRKRNRKQLKVNKKKWYSTRSDAHLLKKYLQKTQAATFLLWPKCSREAVSIGPTAYKTISVTYLTFFFLIGIHSMQGWTAATRHCVTRKKSTKRLKAYRNLFRKSLQLKDIS